MLMLLMSMRRAWSNTAVRLSLSTRAGFTRCLRRGRAGPPPSTPGAVQPGAANAPIAAARTNPYRRIFITGLLAGRWDSTSEARPQSEPDQPRIRVQVGVVGGELVPLQTLRTRVREICLSIIGVQPIRRD